MNTTNQNEALQDLKNKMSPAQDVSDTMYQQYSSARAGTCLITRTGKRINFTNYEYYTNDPEIIRYLNREIADGLRGFTRGELVNVKDINPMAALRRKHIEEFLASQDGRDFSSGDVSATQTAKNVGILSSNDVIVG